MDAINKYSGLRSFTDEERAALLHKPIGGALPADSGLSSVWKKAFEGLGKDGFVIVPPKSARRAWQCRPYPCWTNVGRLYPGRADN